MSALVMLQGRNLEAAWLAANAVTSLGTTSRTESMLALVVLKLRHNSRQGIG